MSELEFGILGPLRVVVDGRKVATGGPRQRTILALLLLSPGRVVGIDTLVDAVWNGRPPATARTQVAICIAALRKSIKQAGVTDEVIVTTHPGYLLAAGEHRIDLAEFEELVSAADTAAEQERLTEAAGHYERALALWRGPALAGVCSRPVETEAEHLEERRLLAFDGLTAVQLRLGHYRDTIPQLTAVVREHPLRERSRLHLMLAQYRSGRRAEALETFRAGRRQFVDELGLEPSKELQELHESILQDDPALTTPAAPATGEPDFAARPVPVELPPDVPGFTGREDYLRRLDEALRRTAGEPTPMVGLITGVAGSGKTGLAVHWAHQVGEHFPDGRLFADLRGYDEHNEPTTAADVLGRFLRSLGVPSRQVPAGPEERVALYRSLLAERRILIVLDNARTFGQLSALLPPSGHNSVLITSRDNLEQLVTSPPDARIAIGALTDAEATALLARIVGQERVDAVPADTARLTELCDRLPLALRTAAARLASKPHWTVRHMVTRLSDEQRRLDELSTGDTQVRSSFAVSYRYLSTEAARLYRRLGLLDVPDFTVWLVAALQDVGPAEAEQLIEQLMDAQFLQTTGTDATGQLRYRCHGLLRIFARELAAQEENEADRAAAIDRTFRACLTVAEQAHRREYGGDFSVMHGSTPRLPPDEELLAELLARPLDWFEAERATLTAVVEQAARLGRDELAWDLTMTMVVLFETHNYLDDWRTCCERSLAAARASGNLRGQAAMRHDLGALALRLSNLAEAYEHLDAARTLHQAAGERYGLALTLRDLAVLNRIRGRLDDATALLWQARTIFQETGDPSSEAHVLNNLAQVELDRDDPDTAVGFALESVRLAEGIGEPDSRGLAQGLHRLARAYLAQGRLPDAESAFLRVAELARTKSDVVGQAHALLGLGETLREAGFPQRTEEALRKALGLARDANSPLVEGRILQVLGETLQDLDRDTDAKELLGRAHRIFARIGTPRKQAAELASTRGQG